MKNEEIYGLIEKQETNIKELFTVHNTALRAKIEAEVEVLGMKMDTLTEYQKIQNARTTTLEDRTGTIENETKFFRFIHRNPKLSGILLGLIILGLIGKNIFDMITAI